MDQANEAHRHTASTLYNVKARSTDNHPAMPSQPFAWQDLSHAVTADPPYHHHTYNIN